MCVKDQHFNCIMYEFYINKIINLKEKLIFTLPFLFLFFFAESVKSFLGRHTKILVKYMIKLETKGDKTENRVLVSILNIY